MCYHVSFKAKAHDLIKAFDAPFPEATNMQEFYHANGFNLPKLPVLVNDLTGRKLELIRWGYIPDDIETLEQALKAKNARLNARAEGVWYNYKDSVFTGRCIVPVTGFFESKHVGKEKVPHFIHPKEHQFFNLLGVHNKWVDPISGGYIDAFTIITGPANELMASIHNSAKRMPLMIDSNQIEIWLDPSLSKDDVKKLMKPCDDRNMAAYPISKIFSKPKIDSNIPEIIEPISIPTLFD